MKAAIFSLLAVAGLVSADVRLPALISDHMLLQRDRPVKIWGWASAGENVTVKLGTQSLTTTASDTGRWMVTLKPLSVGAPQDLTVSGQNTITVRDVLVGEVWIGSGQSNMVWEVRQSNNATAEIAAAKYPDIRIFEVKLKASPVPLEDVEGVWKVCSPETIADFSGVGYYFARHLHQQLRVPIGFIQSAWGGTPAQSWISLPALAADSSLISVYADWGQAIENFPAANARYEKALAQWEKTKQGNRPAAPMGPGHPHEPGSLYNAMIHPLLPYAIRGATWYQGESDSGKRRAYVYRRLFASMIQDWRARWGQGDFPFLFVQLANFENNGEWAELREAQMMTLALRNTGMAVATDIGEAKDIHPKNKQDVGLRLALAARAIAYGAPIVYSGPLFRQAAIEGDKIRLFFDHPGSGLAAKGDGLTGFEIAGADKKFIRASATIDGGTIIVTSPDLAKPIYVRYAWGPNPECNLINREGLPASPFRTDPWIEPTVYR